MKYNNNESTLDNFTYPIDYYYDNKEKEENILNELLLFMLILPFYHVFVLLCNNNKYLHSLIEHNNEVSIRKMNIGTYLFSLIFVIIFGFGFYNSAYPGNRVELLFINLIFSFYILYIFYLLIIEYKFGKHEIIYEQDFNYNPLNQKELKQLKAKKKQKDNKKTMKKINEQENPNNYKRLKGK